MGKAAKSGQARSAILDTVGRLVDRPEDYLDDALYGELATALRDLEAAQAKYDELRHQGV